jgi:N-carbamoylputrescine amidase
MIDADGAVLGLYRKSHIPDGPGYQEKFYFNPGDTGFKVWPTRYGRVGAAICWDQWFPEAARAMALMGAEILCYPTAIGSEPPPAPAVDSSAHWRRVMQGHAAANYVPLIASNRIGREVGETYEITFYGTSFIAGPTGEILADAGRDKEAVITAAVDLDAIASARNSWGLFRDRRPDLYGSLLSLDGKAG